MKNFLFVCLLSLKLFFVVPVFGQLSASFSASTTAGCAPFLVQFTNTSTGNIASYYWELGNGGTSTIKDAGSIYVNSGSYTIKLVVTDVNGNKDSLIRTGYITVYQNPVVDFTADKTTLCDSTTIKFTDATTAGNSAIVKWFWDFGDGGISTQTNPSYAYVSKGDWDVSLQVEDANGCKASLLKPNFISIYNSPKPDFTATINASCQVPLVVNFNNATKNPDNVPLTYKWFFGTGDSSSLTNPSYTYLANGVYDVRLEVTDNNGCFRMLNKPGYVAIRQPKANFFSNDTAGCIPATANFTNTSTGTYPTTTYFWDFGNGQTSTIINPAATYVTAGTYTVMLIASNGVCKDTLTRVAYIKPQRGFSLNFTATDSLSCQNTLTTQFSFSTPATIVSVAWDFGDSTTSAQTSPSKTYNGKGRYTVVLRATDNTGCRVTRSKVNYINLGPITPEFTVDKDKGCAPLAVKFTDQSTAMFTITSRQWKFGDGGTAVGTTASHTYTGLGIFNAKLIITDNKGCKDSVMHEIKTGAAPSPDFTANKLRGCLSNMQVQFTNLSSGADEYRWTFGTGGSSTESDPVYAFDSIGKFTIKLTAYSNGCPGTITKTDYIEVLGPRAAFTVTENPCIADTVRMKSSSLGGTSFDWYINGIYEGSGTTLNKYLSSDTQRIMLVVYDNTTGCYDSALRKIFFRSNFKPGFTNKDTICVNAQVRLTDTSDFAVAWQWIVNGDTSKARNPAFTFKDTGSYDVRLTVTNDVGCTDSVFKPHAFTIVGPIISSEVTPVKQCYRFPGAQIILKHKATTSNQNIVNKTWEIGGATINNAPDSTGYNFNNYPSNANNGIPVIISVDDTKGCKANRTHMVYISAIDATFAMSDSSLLCNTTRMTFRHNVNKSNHINKLWYTWRINDTTVNQSDSPVFVYHASTPGNKKVTLEILEDSLGCKRSTTKFFNVLVKTMKAGFTCSDSIANCPPLTVYFKDKSTVNNTTISRRRWEFSDSSSSVKQAPVKTFFFPGDYDVRYIISDSSGCSDTAFKSKAIKVYGPAGSFTYTMDSGNHCAPVKVDFQATSVFAKSYYWSLDNGVVDSGKNVSTEYTRGGTYDPILILTDSSGCSVTYQAKTPLVINSVPVASFRTESACQGLNARFINESTINSGASLTYLWDFGDGTSSTDDSANKIYAFSGTYPVRLTATSNKGCTDDTLIQVNIRMLNVTADIMPATVCLGSTVSFQDNSFGDTPIISRLWEFGDGDTSTQKNVAHLYNATGIYEVYLTVTDSGGCVKREKIPGVIRMYDSATPAMPVMYRVTVNSNTQAQFEWQPQSLNEFQEYMIYKWTGTTLSDSFYITDPAQGIFLDNNVNTQTTNYQYIIQTVTVCEKRSAMDLSLRHKTILLQTSPGAGHVVLNWNFYQKWNQVRGYEILRRDPKDTGFTKITEVDSLTTNFTDTTVSCDFVYDYMVRAVELNGNSKVSLSNVSSDNADYRASLSPPTVIRATVNTDREIQVDWTSAIAKDPISHYIFEKSVDGVNFKTVYTTPDATCCQPYLDYAVNADEYSYTYRVMAENICGVRSLPSNIGQTILLKAEISPVDEMPSLSWNPYLQWNENVNYYEVEKEEAGGFVTIGQRYPNEVLRFLDSISDLNQNASLCYRIKAIKNRPPFSREPDVVSYSNVDCTSGMSYLHVPSAFTPNGDALNDVFKAQGIYIRRFHILISNRWGQTVFESDDIDQGWDGTYKGKESADDVFIYLIRAVGLDGRQHNLKGMITLLN